MLFLYLSYTRHLKDATKCLSEPIYCMPILTDEITGMTEDQSVRNPLPHPTLKQVDEMAPLQFQPLASQPTPTFWSALNTLKLDKLKLDDAQQPISGWLEEGREVVDRENGDRRVGVDGSLGVGGSSFGEGSEK